MHRTLLPLLLLLLATSARAATQGDPVADLAKAAEATAAAAPSAEVATAATGATPTASPSLPTPPVSDNTPADVVQAVRAYSQTGDAPVLERSDSVLYPYGESQPAVSCVPLRACDIELEAGEVIHQMALGDAERWRTSTIVSGPEGALTPHVIVKPTDYGIATNLIVSTSRRVYHIALNAPSKAKAASNDFSYGRRTRFYYPEDMVQQWTAAAVDQAQRNNSSIGALNRDLDKINTRYTVKGSAPWAPRTVFDDGEHTYLQFPERIRSLDLPAFLGVVDDKAAVMNYRVVGLWYIVDGIFEKAELILGTGRSRQQVKITNDAMR